MEKSDKKTVFEGLLEKGMTMLHLDARRDGVQIPPRFGDDHHLKLNFSWRFHLSHFVINDVGVEADLSFEGTPFLCIIPWHAVFAMTCHANEEWRIWGEDLPEELLERAAALTKAHQDIDEAIEEDNLVEGGAVRRVGHLRVIK